MTDVTATSTVKAVTVYENRAQVQRHATVSLSKGLSRVLFDDLPSTLDRDSLQVGFLSDSDLSGIVLRGIQFDTITVPNPSYVSSDDANGESEKRAEALRTQIRDENDLLALLTERQRTHTKAFSRAMSSATNCDPSVLDPQMWVVKLDEYHAETEALLCEQRQREEKVRTLQTELYMNQKEMRVPVPKELTKSVVAVLLHAAVEVLKLTVVVTYVVDGASWVSEYELRVASDTLLLKLHYNAVVKQTTGEDWKDVHLTLSTARPSVSGRQPELTPWRVNFVQKVVLRAQSYAKKSKGFGVFASSAMKCSEERECNVSNDVDEECDDGESILQDYVAPTIETAVVSEAATSQTFAVQRKMTVQRGGDAIRASVCVMELPISLHYCTVPSILESVFASAKTKNTSSVTLAAGAASVFLDGQFVTRSSIARTSPGQELDISVGPVESVVVKRKNLNRQRSDEGGMFSAKRDMFTYTFINTVKNTKATAVKVQVRERIPVSDNADLVVVLLKPAPESLSEAAQKKLKDEGMVDIDVDVAAGTSLDVPLAFTISAPEGTTVYGM